MLVAPFPLVGGVTAKEFVSPADLLASIRAWQTARNNTDTWWQRRLDLDVAIPLLPPDR